MSESNTSHIHADKPITKQSDDTLGRKNFSDNIARAITNYPTGRESLVMGLYGEWGSGKTSVINMIRESFDNNDTSKTPIIIDFSPWYFSGQDQLFEQFFQQLALGIRSSYEKLKDSASAIANKSAASVEKAGVVADKIIKFSNALRPIKHLSPYVGIPSEMFDNGINAVQKIATHVKSISDAVDKSQTQRIFNPHELKQQISEALSDLDRKVLIIIDDIDRLTKEEIRQIFQLVKALADFQNTIYLLSFDRDEVCAALKDIQTDYPEQYLEKIIQMPFELPILSPLKVFEHLNQALNKTVVVEEWDKSLEQHKESVYYYYSFNTYLNNLRDAARTLNAFNFNYSSLKGEVNVIDLIVMSAIHVKNPSLYSFIKNNKYIFCGAYEGQFLFAREEERNAQAKESYQQFCKIHADTNLIEPLLTQLFPHFKHVLSSPSRNYSPHLEQLKKLQRIASPKHFDKFFSLCVPDDQISDQTIFELIGLQNNNYYLKQRLSELNYKQQYEIISNFITHIEKIEPQCYVRFATALMPLAEDIDESDNIGFFSASLSDYIKMFINNLFSHNQASTDIIIQRYKELFSDDNSGAYLTSRLLWNVIEIVGAKDNDGNFSRELLQQSEFQEVYEDLEKTLTDKISILTREDALLQHHKMISILYSWKRVNETQPIEYANNIIQTQDGLLKFVTGLLGYGYSSNIGKYPRIHMQDVQNFITDIDNFISRLKTIKQQSDFEQFPEKTKIAISALLKGISPPKSLNYRGQHSDEVIPIDF